jgi:hypothetical protein
VELVGLCPGSFKAGVFLWQHYFNGKDYPLWIAGDGAESPGYSEHLRHLRSAIGEAIPIVGFIVVSNDPAGPNDSVREAHAGRLLHLDIVTDTAERIVGRISKVDKR